MSLAYRPRKRMANAAIPAALALVAFAVPTAYAAPLNDSLGMLLGRPGASLLDAAFEADTCIDLDADRDAASRLFSSAPTDAEATARSLFEPVFTTAPPGAASSARPSADCWMWECRVGTTHAPG